MTLFVCLFVYPLSLYPSLLSFVHFGKYTENWIWLSPEPQRPPLQWVWRADCPRVQPAPAHLGDSAALPATDVRVLGAAGGHSGNGKLTSLVPSDHYLSGEKWGGFAAGKDLTTESFALVIVNNENFELTLRTKTTTTTTFQLVTSKQHLTSRWSKRQTLTTRSVSTKVILFIHFFIFIICIITHHPPLIKPFPHFLHRNSPCVLSSISLPHFFWSSEAVLFVQPSNPLTSPYLTCPREEQHSLRYSLTALRRYTQNYYVLLTWAKDLSLSSTSPPSPYPSPSPTFPIWIWPTFFYKHTLFI